ncbi:MAG: V-type ATP synthase subunit A [Candidatus Scalindua sediminis]|nr:V-type ATP synthase subunit A [Candidatus Scalindua sediminis]
MSEGKIIKVSGPLVVAKGLKGTKIYDMVRVGNTRLFGEVIEIRGNDYSIQVYEETEGIGPGEPVYSTNEPLMVELGPGLIGSIFDGIQRPLDVLRRDLGDFILKGAERPSLDREKKWHFSPDVQINDEVSPGDILGTVKESKLIDHKLMVPEGVKGKVLEISEKDTTIEETIAKIKSDKKVLNINMIQKWSVRQPRKVAKRIPPEAPLVTGQRVIDMFFPVVKGGTACVPGPFGSGKTVVQHQLAKWSDADIIVYIGCGERGNEMADVLLELPELKDPKTGESLMERTVLIANTSNMPVAAREASISTGITIAEYYRDMGYSVAVMADSTSRWAEAMREMSGRLEEMPGEEGFPSYLGSRIASFYERSGNVICLGSDNRKGNLSIIGAVSPPGGDLSEPVTQATLRVVKVFWGLDDKLASQRHFPAIDWMSSYSLYHDVVDEYASTKVNPGWKEIRREAMELLKKESELEELIRFVGIDTLSQNDRLIMEVSKMIREDFLRQNAYDTRDTYTSLRKEYLMLDLIIKFYHKAINALKSNVELNKIMCILSKEDISSAEFIPEDQLFKFQDIERKMIHEIDGITENSLGT